MLDVQNISVSFGPIVALEGININIAKREIVCLLGPNGAGKSTLIKAISGQVPIKTGSIRWLGKSLAGLRPYQIVGHKIIQCPEGRQLFSSLSVRENLQLGAGDRKDWNRDKELLCDLFPIIAQRWAQNAGTLSGGEQQMVALARAVVAGPRLLLLDEPSLGLAPKLTWALFDVLPKIVSEFDTAIFIVEQHAWASLQLAQRGYVLNNGKLAYAGIADDVRKYLTSHPHLV